MAHQAPTATARHLDVKAVQNQRAAIINRPEFHDFPAMLGTDKESLPLDVTWRGEDRRTTRGPESTHKASSTITTGSIDSVSTAYASNRQEVFARSNTSSFSLDGVGVAAGTKTNSRVKSKGRQACEQALISCC